MAARIVEHPARMTNPTSFPGVPAEGVPIWQTARTNLARPPLTGGASCDVCVVGAGIFGLTAAFLLQREGRRTVVLDDGEVAGGQTARTTAHLASAIDGRWSTIESVHGRDAARLAAQSHAAAIATIEGIARDERIACDLRRIDGFLLSGSGSARDLRMLEDELDAARRAGLEVEMLPRAPVAGFDTGPCIRFAGQGRLHPLLYLDGLARAFERAGGRIHGGTRVTGIEGGTSARVTTIHGHDVTCGAVVVATNSPVNDRFVVHAKQAPYMTYVVAAPLPEGALPDALLWDTADPYHYVRLVTAEGASRVIVGGEDHKTGQARDGAERFARLETWARARFPAMGTIDHRWAGQVFEPADGLAFIGRDRLGAQNVFIGTGFSGNGMTYGTLGGLLVNDLVCGRQNPWQAVYDPARVRIGSLGRLLRENLNVASRYADWLKPGEVADESAISAGSGAIVRRGLDRLAVYRDVDGTLHRCHAACPHLGCAVAWNPVETTWDCPCHGSRFTATGRVIVGPANRDLTPVEPQRGEEQHGEHEQV